MKVGHLVEPVCEALIRAARNQSLLSWDQIVRTVGKDASVLDAAMRRELFVRIDQDAPHGEPLLCALLVSNMMHPVYPEVLRALGTGLDGRTRRAARHGRDPSSPEMAPPVMADRAVSDAV
ncbi:MAG: Competence protein [Actinomycetia bacterium]|nr:Competence protein [Actinomycetes bacterium]